MPLCSSCSSVVRPLVAVDIDGTLGDYHKAFASFASRYHDVGLPREPYDGSVEMEVWLGLTKAQYREAKLAYRQGGNKRWLPVFPHARALVDGLRANGMEVWVATTRPWQRLDNIDPDTQEWLRRNHFVVDGLLYGDDKYDRLVETVDPSRILGVIDDLDEMLERATALGLRTFQVARSHNEKSLIRRDPRGSLIEALGWATALMVDWEVEHRAA